MWRNFIICQFVQQTGQPCEIYVEILVSLFYHMQLNMTSKREIQRSKTAREWLPRSKRNIDWKYTGKLDKIFSRNFEIWILMLLKIYITQKKQDGKIQDGGIQDG